MWDPLIMPAWLIADNDGVNQGYMISRFAIARNSWTSGDTGGSSGGTLLPLANLAFFIGDTVGSPGEPACGASKVASTNGNNFTVNGGVQINHDFIVNGNANFEDSVNIVGTNLTTDPGVTFNGGGTLGGAVAIEMPPVAEGTLVTDVVLDISTPAVAAYYSPIGTARPLLDAAGNPIMAVNGAGMAAAQIMVTYNGLDGFGHQLWSMTGDANKRITTASIAGNNIGRGFDLKVNGDLTVTGIDGWDGFVWTTGSLSLNMNNADFKQTSDNPGFVLYTGPPGDPVLSSLLVNANLSQESFVGLIYANGNARFNGNGSNNENTINGGLWAKRIDGDCAGVINGNNWGITGNAALLLTNPAIFPVGLAIRSTPDVWLQN